MKAARIVGPQQLEVLDIDMPKPQPGEVLVRMEHLSICGSDLLTYEKVLPEEDYPGRTGYPCHECAGVVVESFDPAFKQGDRVISLAYSGGLVEYSAVTPDLLVRVPESIDQSLGVMIQPIGTVIYALQRAGSVYGKRVVVLGQGPIGLIFTDLLVRGGASQVIVTDVVENQTKIIKSQSDEIKRLKGVRPAPNSGTVEGEDGKSVSKSIWPTNFNEPAVPEDLQF